jgi:hypothetical protein
MSCSSLLSPLSRLQPASDAHDPAGAREDTAQSYSDPSQLERPMLTRKATFLALLLIPSVAVAQGRKMRGEKEADWDKIDKSVQSGPRVSKGDVENFSAIKVIVDKKKDLKLSDDQLKQLKDLDKQEEGANDALYKKIDSLKLAMRKRAGEDEDQERARTSLARQELLTVIRDIRSNYDSTFQVAMPLLDENQKKAATQIVEKERADAEDDLRSKIGGGSGGARQSGVPITRRSP